MKVVVFGASGRVGRLFVDGALKRGHMVTACTRNMMNVRQKHKNLKVSPGNISDDMAVKEAVKGQELVVVTLGAKDISKPHSLYTDGTKRMVAAMQQYKVPRIILLGNVGLLPHPSGQMQGDVNLAPFLQFVFADQRAALTELKDSGLDWIFLCPPFMPQGKQTGKYRVFVDKPLERAQSISVEDVAHFLLREAFEEQHHRVCIGLAY